MRQNELSGGAPANWPATVLVVDDSPIARMGAKRALSAVASGARIVEAGTASAGLDAWRENAPDLGIIDLNMPGDDGLTLCATVLAERPDARLVLCTANAQQAVAERAEAMGVRLVNKPLSADKLAPVLEDLNA